jgi:hypothetical protein
MDLETHSAAIEPIMDLHCVVEVSLSFEWNTLEGLISSYEVSH